MEIICPSSLGSEEQEEQEDVEGGRECGWVIVAKLGQHTAIGEF